MIHENLVGICESNNQFRRSHVEVFLRFHDLDHMAFDADRMGTLTFQKSEITQDSHNL
jgi:hypothetical protein